MRAVRRLAGATTAAALLLAAGLALYAAAKSRPQDLPWTKLDLGQPIGLFTGRKLARLGTDLAQCRALLDRAGVRYTVLPPVRAENGRCGYADGVRFAAGGARSIRFAPADLGTACPVAAALAVWEWEVVQPAARRHFGQPVVRIDHLGSYSCRRLYGRSEGDWSEHATADAIDVAGFRLGDGTRISVLGDWEGEGAKAAFLREVRDGGCRLFATVLSPDYNAAHRDHLHMDQAARGEMGWRACR
jgi:hypothetical protein